MLLAVLNHINWALQLLSFHFSTFLLESACCYLFFFFLWQLLQHKMQCKKDAEKLGVETFAHCHTRDVFRGFQEKQIEQFIMNGNISLHFLTDICTLLQGWKCFKFTNADLSCCCLSMAFDQSALSDLRP